MSNTPSDAEIIELMRDGYNCRYNYEADHIEFARAVLEKWGSPVVATEPVAEYDEWFGRPVLLYGAPTLKHKQKLYATPQPTQAQAGAVPLQDEQIAEMMRDTWGCASIAPRHALEFARAVERAVERANGIKGENHEL